MATKLTTDILGLDNATQAVEFTVGTGDPNGLVTAVTGSIFVDATTPGLYQNDSGGTVWSALGGGWPTTVGTDYAGTPYEQALVAAANGNLIISPNGNGALIAQVPNGAVSGGITRGQRATDWQRNRFAADQVASGNGSTISGGFGNRALGGESTVGGGIDNEALGDRSTVGGGESNEASTRHATVSGGQTNRARADWSTVSGGFTNVANTNYSTVSGGSNNTAGGIRSAIVGGPSNTTSGYASTAGGKASNVTGNYAVALGGNLNSASGDHASVLGSVRAAATHYAERAHAAGRFASDGDAQYCRMVLRNVTADATPTVITADAGAASAVNTLSLANSTLYRFRIDLVASEHATGDSAWWEIAGCIKRGAGAGTTTLVGSTYTTTDGDAGAAAWTVAVTADTTLGTLQIEVTGEALKDIRWVATVHATRLNTAP